MIGFPAASAFSTTETKSMRKMNKDIFMHTSLFCMQPGNKILRSTCQENDEEYHIEFLINARRTDIFTHIQGNFNAYMYMFTVTSLTFKTHES